MEEKLAAGKGQRGGTEKRRSRGGYTDTFNGGTGRNTLTKGRQS